MKGIPPSGGLKARGVAKCSDFGPIEGYISETVQDRRNFVYDFSIGIKIGDLE